MTSTFIEWFRNSVTYFSRPNVQARRGARIRCRDHPFPPMPGRSCSPLAVLIGSFWHLADRRPFPVLPPPSVTSAFSTNFKLKGPTLQHSFSTQSTPVLPPKAAHIFFYGGMYLPLSAVDLFLAQRLLEPRTPAASPATPLNSAFRIRTRTRSGDGDRRRTAGVPRDAQLFAPDCRRREVVRCTATRSLRSGRKSTSRNPMRERVERTAGGAHRIEFVNEWKARNSDTRLIIAPIHDNDVSRWRTHLLDSALIE
jgi:hypothetical protein